MRRKFVGIFAALVLSPAFAGLKFVVLTNLGLAPQALCSRLLRRLRTDFSGKARKKCLQDSFVRASLFVPWIGKVRIA